MSAALANDNPICTNMRFLHEKSWRTVASLILI
ncbi:MAG: hypothetical protein GDYSWBUE_001681, partial [Candidatus Fervidibacterota bacterium]